MFAKIIALLLIILALEPPITGIINYVIFSIVIFLFFGITRVNKFKYIFNNNKQLLILLLISLIVKNFIPKLDIHEAHSVFLNLNDIKILSKILPNHIIDDIIIDYEKFDLKKFFNAHREINEEDFKNKFYIKKEYAYNSDGFFQKKKYSRLTDKINFNSIEDLRIDHLNSIIYNLKFDKEFRRNLPFYFLFEIPKLAKGSQICSEGKSYYYFSNEELNSNQIKNIKFKNLESLCLEYDKNYQFLYVIGYSIDKKNKFNLNLNKNLKLKVLEYFTILLSFIQVLIIIFLIFKIKLTYNSYLYLISIFATIFIALLKDVNLLTGLRYFRGGADGLYYYSLARDILFNLENRNIYEALRGGEDVFYYMPGQRYFVAFSNMIFGASSYGYLLIASTLPIAVYNFFKKYINHYYAIVLFLLFIFFPIFENLGFGYFNYIHQVNRNHAETLSILLIISSLVFTLYRGQNLNNTILIFSVGLILSFASILRPNFILTSSFIIFYLSYYYYVNKKYYNILFLLFGFASILFCLIHNLYFGDKFVIFINSYNSHNFPININTYLSGIYNILTLNLENLDLQKMINHLSRWNPLYNTHRIIIICFIIFYFLRHKESHFNYLIFMCFLMQHGVLLLSNPDSNNMPCCIRKHIKIR